MEEFNLAVFRFYFISLEEIRLPKYKGSTFRGGFGTTFKRVVCINNERDCKVCLLKFKCVYCYVFETPIKGHMQFNTTHLPHPYILEPPSDNENFYSPGHRFSINLVLIGRAVEYLPYFVFVMEKLGENGIGKGRGRFLLDRVETLSHPSDNDGKIIFDRRTKRLSGEFIATNFQFTEAREDAKIGQGITIDFLTPTRITFKNRLVGPSDFNFPIFIRNVFRRMFLLSHHCKTTIEIDYKKFLLLAENVDSVENHLYWHDWERYSARQDTRMKLGGFKGKITFKGTIQPFLSFIRMGEYIHIGQDTSFGLGKYSIKKIGEMV